MRVLLLILPASSRCFVLPDLCDCICVCALRSKSDLLFSIGVQFLCNYFCFVCDIVVVVVVVALMFLGPCVAGSLVIGREDQRISGGRSGWLIASFLVGAGVEAKVSSKEAELRIVLRVRTPSLAAAAAVTYVLLALYFDTFLLLCSLSLLCACLVIIYVRSSLHFHVGMDFALAFGDWRPIR